MHVPQIIYIILLAIGVLNSTARHGQPQPNYNMWVSLFGTGLTVGLLIWGGFFSN